MIVYEKKLHVPDSDLVDLGDPADLGGTVLEGSPRISARVDFQQEGLLAGIFEATTGVVRIDFPFTEMATIIEGQVELTDEAGNHATLKPGDSYFIRQGEIIRWEVKGRRVRKLFYNFTRS